MEYKQITIDDKSIIDKYFFEYGENSCQHSFAQMMAFNSKYGDEYAISNDCLIVHRKRKDTDSKRVYLFPMGKKENIKAALESIIKETRAKGKLVEFNTVTKNAKDTVFEIYPGRFDVEESRDYSEYIYDRDSLATLEGRKLASKRNRVRAFWSEYEGHVKIEKITKDNIEDVRAFQRLWCDNYDNKDAQPIEIENEAVRVGLDNFRALGLRGIVVYIDDEIKAYAYGVDLSYNCVDEMIEKADRNITGLYQMLNNEFVKRVCKDYLYVNREEDIGIEGLRIAKQRYCPAYLLDKYILTEKLM